MIRPVLLGPSGIGKTPVSKLFKLECWHPRRVRPPRNAEDARACLTPEEFARIERGHATETPLYAGERGLRVYPERSLFQVRGTDQCLEHTSAAGDPGASLLIELFAPIFVDLLRHRHRLGSAISLDPDQLLVLLLNPVPQSCTTMAQTPVELSLAVHTAIVERSRLLGQGIDLKDIVRRVSSVHEEAASWRELLELVPERTVECRAWPHFEYRYMEPEGDGAAGELSKARQTLLAAVADQAPQALSPFEAVLRTPSEIAEMTGIV